MSSLRYLYAISTAITILALAPSAHADMLIDDYNQGSVGPSGSTVLGAGILGGARTVTRLGQASVSLNGTSESLTAYGNSFGGTATDMTAIDSWGKQMNLNLTGYSGVQLDFSAVNQPINLVVTLHRATGNYSSVGWLSFLTVNQNTSSIFLPFSSFNRIPGTDTALNLSDIDAVGAMFTKTKMYLDTPSAPIYSIDNIKFVSVVSSVPEPENYAMLVAGLGLMGGVARRRKARQA